ncbi:MAG: glycosyltransferase family 2 protein [Coriobacteriia bacterium]
MAPLVYVILVNWNGFDDTVACVESCLALDYAPFHLVVVDNDSADGSGIRLAERFASESQVEVLLAERNLGFAGGNNLGIRHALDAGAEYVWLLNNDTVVDPPALRELVSAAQEHPEAGMVGSKVFYFDRPNVLWFAGGVIKTHRDGTTYHRGMNEVDTGAYDAPAYVDYVTGCSLLTSAEVVRSIGLMAEEYFLYWEEVDWCDRARAAGYSSLCIPTSRVWHKVGGSLGADASWTRIRYDARNRLLFYRRNRPKDMPRVLFWLNRQIVTLTLVRGKPQHSAALLRGELDYFLGKRGPIDAS